MVTPQEPVGDKTIRVGTFDLVVPGNHYLERFQKQYKRYDVPLGEVAACLSKKYNALASIDIGANVGASAALLHSKTNGAVLCIEGDEQSLTYLRKNVQAFGAYGTIEACFVGIDNTFVDVNKVDRPVSTSGSFVGAVTANKTACSMKSLFRLVQEHPTFSNAKLIKIDTDGFDFAIIQASLDFFTQTKPAIFFEYAPAF